MSAKPMSATKLLRTLETAYAKQGQELEKALAQVKKLKADVKKLKTAGNTKL